MSSTQQFQKIIERQFPKNFLADSPLLNHCWYNIGGPAAFLVYPDKTEGLLSLLNACHGHGYDSCLIGQGANMLVSDSGYNGVMINLSRHFTSITSSEDLVRVESGALISDLVRFCEDNALGGLEFMAGIPGTVGGALVMNAGTHDGEIGERVVEVEVLDQNLVLKKLTRQEISFGYRAAPEIQECTVLSCTLRLYSERGDRLREYRQNQLQVRANRQPLEYPSCGSVFKRPKNHFVGKMVEELGLKGLRHGGAMISDKHAGFIVNLGGALAADVLYLIRTIQDKVFQQYGVELEPEVRFVGFEGN